MLMIMSEMKRTWPMILAGYKQRMPRTAYPQRSRAFWRAKSGRRFGHFALRTCSGLETMTGESLLMGQQKRGKCQGSLDSSDNTEKLKMIEEFWLRSWRSAAKSANTLRSPVNAGQTTGPGVTFAGHGSYHHLIESGGK